MDRSFGEYEKCSECGKFSPNTDFKNNKNNKDCPIKECKKCSNGYTTIIGEKIKKNNIFNNIRKT